MKDLFGIEVAEPPALPVGAKGKRKPTVLRGYAGTPGRGPVGETCKSCEHYTLVRFAKSYRKCELISSSWTHGPGTDIKASSPACQFWEKAT